MIPVIDNRFKSQLKRFETDDRPPEDREIDLGQATAAVLGMGRIGTAAYDNLREKQGKTLVSLDFDEDRIPALKDEGDGLRVQRLLKNGAGLAKHVCGLISKQEIKV
ncbi:MAG: hypothetical protein HKP52_06080 [Desulfofustis sp.]|nr:hypothetical protein [Desulfofustis sp.]